MSFKSLFNKAAVVAAPLVLATGCALQTLPRQAVTVDDNVQYGQVVLNPCTRENIKLRAAYEVTRGELMRRERDGEDFYQYKGYYLFAQKGVVERWAPLAGAVAFGALGSTIGHGAVSLAAGVGGAFGGAAGGSALAENSRLARMAQESGCEGYVDTLAGSRARVPVPNRGLDEGSYGGGYRRSGSGWAVPRQNPYGYGY